MNRAVLVVSVRRPEGGVGDVRKRCPGTRRSLWQRIDGLGTIARTKEIRSGVVKDRALLQVVGPIGYVNYRAGHSVRLDCILIVGSVDQAQVVQNPARLRAFAGAEESGHS